MSSAPSLGRDARVFDLSWLGAILSLGLPEKRWATRIGDLTGLEIQQSIGGVGEITVLGDNRIRSYADDVDFAGHNDLLVWLTLTCADVLAEKRGALLLHAASLLTEKGLVLVFGPPLSGKSTLAMLALDRGLNILGDDVVFLSTDDGLVRPVPRPLKRRITDQCLDSAEADPLEIGSILYGSLDGKPCALIPRSRSGISTSETGIPTGRLVFMKRHDGAGIQHDVPERFEAVASLLDWARDWSTPTLAAAGWVIRHLLNLEYRTLSVGDGAQEQALDAILGDDLWS